MKKETVHRGSDIENKFVLQAHRAPLLRAWVQSRCEKDPRFPASLVSSVYFDTADWRFLRDKDESDFLKTKVRLRWYSDVRTGQAVGGPFLEVKHKIGSQRDKLRAEVDLDASWLAASRLDHPDFLEVPLWLARMGERMPRPLQPALEIRYRRTRYVHRASSSRLCVDSDIEVPRVNPRMLVSERPYGCRSAVLEVKSEHAVLPTALQPALKFGCRKASFSKYMVCCAGLLRT